MAQAYKGLMGMNSCKTLKQAFNAFTRGEVVLSKKLIKARNGSYSRCMAYSQTGFERYAGFLQAYIKMDVNNMDRYMKSIYSWESTGLRICVNKGYPSTRMYSNWNNCVRSTALVLAADRDFGIGYMTMQRSNWRRLGADLYKMLVYSGVMEESCNLNQMYEPKYSVSQKALKKCVVDTAYTMYWLKQSALSLNRMDWMNVFLDMSRATMYVEKSDVSCNFKPKWVRRSRRLTTDESKMPELVNIDIDLSDIAKPPQELSL